MKTITQSALFENSAANLYQIVNDIEQYPNFIEGCISASIVSNSEKQMVGKLVFQQSGVILSVTTRNTMIANRRIDLHFIEGSLKDLSGSWVFKPLTDNACKVTLELNYQFSNPIKNLAAARLVKPLSSKLIAAIALRCKQCKGSGRCEW